MSSIAIVITRPPVLLAIRGCPRSTDNHSTIKITVAPCRGMPRGQNRAHKLHALRGGGTATKAAKSDFRISRNAHDLIVGMTMSSWSASAGLAMVAANWRGILLRCLSLVALQQLYSSPQSSEHPPISKRRSDRLYVSIVNCRSDSEEGVQSNMLGSGHRWTSSYVLRWGIAHPPCRGCRLPVVLTGRQLIGTFQSLEAICTRSTAASMSDEGSPGLFSWADDDSNVPLGPAAPQWARSH
jgi:hypothetical protein